MSFFKTPFFIIAVIAGVSAVALIILGLHNLPLNRETKLAPKTETSSLVPAGKAVETGTPPATPPNTAHEGILSLAQAVAGFFYDCQEQTSFGDCMDGRVHEILKTYTTKDALVAVQTLEDTDPTIRIACHEVVHAIGRETFAKEKTIHDSFAACDQTCHSGCYHGAMERFLRGDATNVPEEERAHISEGELAQKITTACVPDAPINLRFQCLHGLGHAILFYISYDLPKALGYCDKLSTSWDRASCWGGAFMENIHSATPEKRYLSTADYHFPCSVIDVKYRSDCYVMQTTRMAEMGLGRPQIIVECEKAAAYRLQCLQSLGRDASNDVRAGNGASIVTLCESIPDADGLRACLRGVAYALADNTWDGTYAFPFCGGFKNPGDREYCYSLSTGYLKSMLLVAKEKIQKDCVKFVPADALCTSETGKL